MAKKVTSRRVAKEASKILRSKKSPARTRSVAGSALSQREKKGTYKCPNCESGKPTLRGRCPICNYAGNH